MIDVGDRPEDTLIEFVRAWFRLLARAEWEEALAAIDEPNVYGIRWTRDEVTGLLQDTFGAGTRFEAEHGPPVFSDPDSAAGAAHHSFGRLNAGGFWLDHDVPLNGRYSDLTAQFEFLPRDRRFAVQLHGLHVL
jgi:hypothetical protein